MTNLFILTSPRETARPFEYLEDLVAEIDDEQLPDDVCKTIVLDGRPADRAALEALLEQLHTEGRPWDLELFEKAEGAQLGGNKLAYWRTLELAHQINEGAVVLEDDLQSCRNATMRALVFPVPSDVDLVQMYSGFTIKHPLTEAGLWRSPARFRGCQAVKYPARTLKRLVAWAQQEEFQKFTASDEAVDLARARLGLRLAHHVPDLYQHEGRRSAVGDGLALEGGITDELSQRRLDETTTGRQSATWPGNTFDAMRLFIRHEAYK